MRKLKDINLAGLMELQTEVTPQELQRTEDICRAPAGALQISFYRQ